MHHGLRLDAVLAQHVKGDPLSLPGRHLSAGVQEDLRVTRANGDVAAELAADVFFHLMPRQGSLRPSDLRLVSEGDRHAPVIAVRHGVTLAHPPAPASLRPKQRSGAPPDVS